jgi:hypothetical protein
MERAEPRSDQALTDLLAVIPFTVTLGIELVSATPEEVVGRARGKRQGDVPSAPGRQVGHRRRD